MDWQIVHAYIPVTLAVAEAVALPVFDWTEFIPHLFAALAPFEEARKSVLAALDRYDPG